MGHVNLTTPIWDCFVMPSLVLIVAYLLAKFEDSGFSQN